MTYLIEYETDEAYKSSSSVVSSTDTADSHNAPDTTKHTESKASEPVFNSDLELQCWTLQPDLFVYEYTTPFSEGRQRCLFTQPRSEDVSKGSWLPSVTPPQLKHFAETFSVPEDDEAQTKLSHMISWAARELLSGHPYYGKVMRDDDMGPNVKDMVKEDFFENGTTTEIAWWETQPEDPGPRVTKESLFSLAYNLLSEYAKLPNGNFEGLQVRARTPALSSFAPIEAT